jgi:hypothetical protein
MTNSNCNHNLQVSYNDKVAKYQLVSDLLKESGFKSHDGFLHDTELHIHEHPDNNATSVLC